MDKKLNICAVIPARGGSKGLPRKNLRPLAGKPLLGHTISAALDSALVTDVFVSTDDDVIEQFSTKSGASALRHPPELSADDRPSFPVIKWVLEHLDATAQSPDLCVVLRATAPLRTSSDIDNAIRLLVSSPDFSSVASVVRAIGINPTKLKKVGDDGRLTDGVEKEGRFPTRRQDGGDFFVRNEALYVVRPEVIRGGSLWGEQCRAFEMPEKRSININTEFQFHMAELLFMDESGASPE